MTLVHLINLMTSEDLASPTFSSSLNDHFDSTLLPIFQQHGRRIASISPPGENRKSEAGEKMMLMANAESHLSLLKSGLIASGSDTDEEDQKMDAEDKTNIDVAKLESSRERRDEVDAAQSRESLVLVEKLLSLFYSSKVADVDDRFAEDAAFPTINTAPNFKQTFD